MQNINNKNNEKEKRKYGNLEAFFKVYTRYYKNLKLKEARERYRTIRGIAYFSLIQRVKKFCDNEGLTGCRRPDYINFARTFSRLLWTYVAPISKNENPEKIKERIDKLLEIVEDSYINRFKLDKELVERLEKILVKYAIEVYNSLRLSS